MQKTSTLWFKIFFVGLIALTFLITGCSGGGDAPFWFWPEPEPEDQIVRMTLLQTTDMHDTVSGIHPRQYRRRYRAGRMGKAGDKNQ
jgi:hypothetical protein